MSNINVGVLVSRYPRSIPLDAEQSNTAGAANARTIKNWSAYVYAIGPVIDVPMTCNNGDRYTSSIIISIVPNTIDNDNACPPTWHAPLSSPVARLPATKGEVDVAKKLNI